MSDTAVEGAVSARMAAYDRRVQPLIVLAAVAPLVVALLVSDANDTFYIVVDLASWAVFVVDLVARIVIDRRYLRSGSGIFDLAIVLLTFPWYILPFGQSTEFMSVFRLARLLRVFTATSSGSRLKRVLARLGSLGLFLLIVSLIASAIVRRAEPPDSGYESFGDALWWSVVSFTTVGYGDLFPTTPMGRFAGVLMMLAGLAALGTVSAVLADMFRGNSQEDGDDPVQELVAEVKALRRDVAVLQQAVGKTAPEPPGSEAADG